MMVIIKCYFYWYLIYIGTPSAFTEWLLVFQGSLKAFQPQKIGLHFQFNNLSDEM